MRDSSATYSDLQETIGGVTVGYRTLDQMVMSSIPGRVTTLGKLFTPMFLCYQTI